MVDNYLNVLEESLMKKIDALNSVQEYNNRQQKLFQSEITDITVFDSYVEEKEQLIEQINKLDEGFENLYDAVAEELQNNRDKYKPQIRRLQELVRKVTDMSISVQAQEARNKKLIEDYFSRERSSICQNRKTSKAAYDYYKNMNNSSVVPPQFMDRKK